VAGRYLVGHVPEPRAADDLVGERAATGGQPVRRVERDARRVGGHGRKGREPRLEGARHRLARRVPAEKSPDLADLAGGLLEGAGGGQELDPDAEAAEHRDGGGRRPRAPEHEVGFEEVDLLGPAPVHRPVARRLRHRRGAPIAGEIGHRDELSRRRQHHCELIGAQVDRDDAPGRLV